MMFPVKWNKSCTMISHDFSACWKIFWHHWHFHHWHFDLFSGLYFRLRTRPSPGRSLIVNKVQIKLMGKEYFTVSSTSDFPICLSFFSCSSKYMSWPANSNSALSLLCNATLICYGVRTLFEMFFTLWSLIQDTLEKETYQSLKGHNSVRS